MLLTCQAGFEAFLAREAEERGAVVAEKGPGWVRTVADFDTGTMTFPHLALMAPVEIKGQSVNALAQAVAQFFLEGLRGERIEAAWPCLWLGPQEIVGLGRRTSAVEAAFGELLKKKLARVAKLAGPELPRGIGRVRGLAVLFVDFGRAFAARELIAFGQRRMADDERAPSRSYLKVEEAYGVLGREPQAGETVVDLGAAPGGWSYSAARRGARVVAIDNGPLKGGALDHPLVEHRREDAFKFEPPAGGHYDWLFCDMVEEPHNVLRNIIEPWLTRRWCRRFVINLKFGRVDPLAFVKELRAPGSPLMVHAPGTIIRHLYHDREEFTLVGEVAAS
ncbi:MAG TPA: SAM-dependent methyltransferase [Opitutaceae bacterium]|nr:SAM-dependent methyltransferase [Opitutaceae bacterium]